MYLSVRSICAVWRNLLFHPAIQLIQVQLLTHMVRLQVIQPTVIRIHLDHHPTQRHPWLWGPANLFNIL